MQSCTDVTNKEEEMRRFKTHKAVQMHICQTCTTAKVCKRKQYRRANTNMQRSTKANMQRCTDANSQRCADVKTQRGKDAETQR